MAALPPFQALLDAHAGAVHRFLRASVGPGEADDCFQETFLSALRAYPELRDASNLRGWLFTIAHRKALDAHRARGRRPVPVAEVPEGRGAAPTAGANGGDAELWAHVGALAPKQRSAVALRYLADLEYSEIGEAIACSPEAARRNVFEGLRRLREEWTP